MKNKHKKSSDRKLKNNNFLFVGITLVVLLIDQITKYLAKQCEYSIELTDFFSITYGENTGAAFGILQNANIFLVVLTLIVVIGIIYYKYKNKIEENMISFVALLLGGASGNLVDRIFRGYVIDFINFSFWPSFNVADMGITLGVMGMIIVMWNKK